MHISSGEPDIKMLENSAVISPIFKEDGITHVETCWPSVGQTKANTKK